MLKLEEEAPTLLIIPLKRNSILFGLENSPPEAAKDIREIRQVSQVPIRVLVLVRTSVNDVRPDGIKAPKLVLGRLLTRPGGADKFGVALGKAIAKPGFPRISKEGFRSSRETDERRLPLACDASPKRQGYGVSQSAAGSEHCSERWKNTPHLSEMLIFNLILSLPSYPLETIQNTCYRPTPGFFNLKAKGHMRPRGTHNPKS